MPSELKTQTTTARRRRSAPVYAHNGMAAGQHPLVTTTALRTLATGGNAVDAAIAAAWTATVVLPAMTSIGGDLFAIVGSAIPGSELAREPISVLSSGIAPRGASIDHMREHGEDGGRLMPQQGPLSPSVPGFVAGVSALHERYATMPFSQLMEPAIGYAAEGFPLSPMITGWIESDRWLLVRTPATASVFVPGGRVPKPGEMLRQTALASTLELVAREGPGVFYQGSIASDIAAFLATVGGALTADDFADHQATVIPAISSSYNGYTVYQTGLPTQGFVMLEAMNILEQDDLRELGVESSAGIHLMAESLKLAFEDRHRYAADPAVVSTPLDTLLSKEHARELRQSIRPDEVRQNQRAPALSHGDTTYLNVIDRDGLMVSLITSVSAAFGSGVVAGETGVLLNNRAGNCFSLVDDHPNCYAPGKKTMHTLNCFLVGDSEGTPLLTGGTPGGDGQPQWNLQMVAGMVDCGLDVQGATELPRWSVWPATYPAEIENEYEIRIESQIGPEVIDGLREIGHQVNAQEPWSMGGAAQLIARDPETGVMAGGSDPRPEGMAAGL